MKNLILNLEDDYLTLMDAGDDYYVIEILVGGEYYHFLTKPHPNKPQTYFSVNGKEDALEEYLFGMGLDLHNYDSIQFKLGLHQLV